MEKIKATLRIPTNTAYAFIEVTIEGTPQEIISKYFELSEAYHKEVRIREERLKNNKQ